MKKIFKNIFLSILIYNLLFSNLLAENLHFIDFTKVLNQSKAGAEAQEKLQKKFLSESEIFKKEEEKIKKEETDLISQKKAISSEDYKKKVDALRNKVSELQKKKQESLNLIAKSRLNAKKELLEAVNPIIKKYMEQNNIRIVLDKQSIILGDTKLEITDKIIEILNNELKSIKVN